MTLQTQEKGSYRASDMVELLSARLPQAVHDYDSQVVILDWYTAHRDEAVAAFIAARGHVLLLHGGGTTGYEQVNDTHLHAQLQARLKELEVAMFYGELSDPVCSDLKETCPVRTHIELCTQFSEIRDADFGIRSHLQIFRLPRRARHGRAGQEHISPYVHGDEVQPTIWRDRFTSV